MGDGDAPAPRPCPGFAGMTLVGECGKDERWGKTSLVIRRGEGGAEVRREPLPPLPDNLQRIIDENQES